MCDITSLQLSFPADAKRARLSSSSSCSSRVKCEIETENVIVSLHKASSSAAQLCCVVQLLSGRINMQRVSGNLFRVNFGSQFALFLCCWTKQFSCFNCNLQFDEFFFCCPRVVLLPSTLTSRARVCFMLVVRFYAKLTFVLHCSEFTVSAKKLTSNRVWCSYSTLFWIQIRRKCSKREEESRGKWG